MVKYKKQIFVYRYSELPFRLAVFLYAPRVIKREHPAAPTITPIRNVIPNITRAIVAPLGFLGSFPILVYLLGLGCVRSPVPLLIPLFKILAVAFVLKEIPNYSAQHRTDGFSLISGWNIYGHLLYLSS